MSDDARVGQTIANRFRLEERLGAGGYGAVYRARHTATGGEVAVKLVRADHAGKEMIAKRFLKEAQNTHKLHHPNTVRIADFGETGDGDLYIVMELVKGRALADVIWTEGPLPVERTLRILTQVLKSLGEAHGIGVIHRDVKPDNIMLVDQFGEPDFVKVLDFGISRSMDTGATTTGGALIGTPLYMAPEQWLSMPVDARTDLYAVGMMAYQMIAGRMPFDVPQGNDPKSALALMAAHCELARRPMLEAAPDTPPHIADLIDQLIARNPDDRPGDVETVLRVIRGEAPLPAPARSKGASVVVGTEETLAADAPPTAAPLDTLLPDPMSSEPPPPGSRTRWLIGGAVVAGIAALIAGLNPPESPSTPSPTEASPSTPAPADRPTAAPSPTPTVEQWVRVDRPPESTTRSGRATPDPLPAPPPLTLELTSVPSGARVTIANTKQALGPTPLKTELPDEAAALIRDGFGLTLVLTHDKLGRTRTTVEAADLNAPITVKLKRPRRPKPRADLPTMRIK